MLVTRPIHLRGLYLLSSSWLPSCHTFHVQPPHSVQRRLFGKNSTTSIIMADAESEDNTILLGARKQALRKEIRAKVRALPDDELVAQSERVWERLFALPEYQAARTVGLFLSMPKNEIKTETALRHCVENGKIVYIPEVGKNFENADMELRRVFIDDKKDDNSGPLFYESWPKNKWGIPEPPESMPKQVAEPGDIDLLVVPGLGFDCHGNRIGQGKGYYDRFIARIAKNDKPNLIAVTLDCQFVEGTIPVSHLDRVMDKILLPSQVIQVTKS